MILMILMMVCSNFPCFFHISRPSQPPGRRSLGAALRRLPRARRGAAAGPRRRGRRRRRLRPCAVAAAREVAATGRGEENPWRFEDTKDVGHGKIYLVSNLELEVSILLS